MATIQELTQEKLEAGIRNTSSWFFWILGLSLLNSLITYFKFDVNFLMGITLTRILDVGVAQNSVPGSELTTVLLVLTNLLVFSFFLVAGVFSRRNNLTIFIAGTAIYALDSILSLVVQDYLSFGFHWFALFFLISGSRFVSEAKRRTKLIETGLKFKPEILPVFSTLQTLIGTHVSINYDSDSNQLISRDSKISTDASLSIHLTLDGTLDVRNIYDPIDLSQEFLNDYLGPDGKLNISLKCKRIENRILVTLSKYREGEFLQQVEEEFELKPTMT